MDITDCYEVMYINPDLENFIVFTNQVLIIFTVKNFSFVFKSTAKQVDIFSTILVFVGCRLLHSTEKAL